jgi:hypothetical protein
VDDHVRRTGLHSQHLDPRAEQRLGPAGQLGAQHALEVGLVEQVHPRVAVRPPGGGNSATSAGAGDEQPEPEPGG